MRNIKNLLHYYIFPRWSADYKCIILLCSIISCLGGSGGALLQHYKNPLGVYAWHIGLIAVLACMIFYIKGTYRKYLDYAWDAYY